MTTHHLETDQATLAYDVRGALPPADGRPPLLMIGQPMTADGFATLASHFADRTVVTYDPRGLGRSTRTDGTSTQTPQQQAEDLHALIEAIGSAPVDIFASSGGAVSALALVARYPHDVATLVAHEPPIIPVLPDAELAFAAERAWQKTYQEKGSGWGMAQFMSATMWRGEFTDAYLSQPPPDPAQFGMSPDDDGSRDDPLLAGVANAVTSYQPDTEAIQATPTRVVIAVGVESQGTFTGRTSESVAKALDLPLTEFPSHHGGFLGDERGYGGQPEAFAERLRQVLDGAR